MKKFHEPPLVTALRAERSGVRIRAESRDFSFLQEHLKPIWGGGTPCLLYNGYWVLSRGYGGRDVKSASHVRQMLRSRMSEAFLVLLYMCPSIVTWT
jgi:hypothetical protein